MKERIIERLKRKHSQYIIMGIVLALLLAGCGTAGNEQEKAALDAVEEPAENTDETPAADSAESSEETVEEDETDALTANEDDKTLAKEENTETADGAASTDKKPVTMAELVGEARKAQQGEELPETVLWFNATYAPLTYSNGWNWRLLGGLEPTEENRDISKTLLESSWSVQDRESALETTAKLLKDGHRKKCLDYTKQMEEWGILELGEEEFVEQLLSKELEELDGEPGRYAVAYQIHQAGLEPEVITAWDLCRVNQLYADYYFCGYMTYEEAMDASLANSLNLQELYGSWEEMVEAYLLGYRFWQGEPIGTPDGFDSPTQERRHYYEMLQEMEDGPYTLDWNMELKKSW